jgi:hypothetical protein
MKDVDIILVFLPSPGEGGREGPAQIREPRSVATFHGSPEVAGLTPQGGRPAPQVTGSDLGGRQPALEVRSAAPRSSGPPRRSRSLTLGADSWPRRAGAPPCGSGKRP